MAQLTPPSWRVGAACDSRTTLRLLRSSSSPPFFITTQNSNKTCSKFFFPSTHFLQKFWSRSKPPLVIFMISHSLTIDLIVAALTVQVHIIPGLISGILTSFTTSSPRVAMSQPSFPTPNANVNLLAYLHCPTSPLFVLHLVVRLPASFKIAQPFEYFLRDTALILPFIPLSRPVVIYRAFSFFFLHNHMINVKNIFLFPVK